jgi:hypothetical protein
VGKTWEKVAKELQVLGVKHSVAVLCKKLSHLMTWHEVSNLLFSTFSSTDLNFLHRILPLHPKVSHTSLKAMQASPFLRFLIGFPIKRRNLKTRLIASGRK